MSFVKLMKQDVRQQSGTSGVLSRNRNELLEAAVKSAAAAANAPMALVTLLTDNLQFFRASVGLPVELATSLATSRCDSFCQYVVATQQAVEVDDAAIDPRIPKPLVTAFGLRSYAGVPVRVADEVVGSLCVLDIVPRHFGNVVVQHLSAIAGRVSQELTRLASDAGADDAAPASLVFESYALTALADAFAKNELSPPEAARGLRALGQLNEALELSVRTAHESVRSLITDFLSSLAPASRSFALSRLMLRTGFSNTRELENAKSLCESVTREIARMRAEAALQHG